MPAVLCVHKNGTVSVLRDLTQEQAEDVVERLTFAKEREKIIREETEAYRQVYDEARESGFRGEAYLRLPSGRMYFYQVIDMPTTEKKYTYGRPSKTAEPYVVAAGSAAPQSEFTRVEVI